MRDPRKKGYAGQHWMIQQMNGDQYHVDLSIPAHLTIDLPLLRTDPLTKAPDLIQCFIINLQGRTLYKQI